MYFFDHSNLIQAQASPVTLWAKVREGIEKCPEGKSFAIPVEEVANNATFRAFVSNHAKKHGRRFSVCKHDAVYEVARIEVATERTFIGSGNELGANQTADPFNWPLPNLEGIEDHAERLRLCTIDPNPEYDGEYQINRPKPPALKAIIRTEMIALGLPVPNEEDAQ